MPYTVYFSWIFYIYCIIYSTIYTLHTMILMNYRIWSMNVWVQVQDLLNSSLQLLWASVFTSLRLISYYLQHRAAARIKWDHVQGFCLLQSASQVPVISITLYSPRKWPLSWLLLTPNSFQRAVIFKSWYPWKGPGFGCVTARWR